MAIQWIHYPKSAEPPLIVRNVVEVFEGEEDKINSLRYTLKSNEVLAQVSQGLLKLGFEVETGKRKDQRVNVPVLFGLNGCTEKSFEADAYHKVDGFVLEVEAGRAVVNNQFLKDLFQACMMHGVCQLCIAVRNVYGGGGRQSKDFERVVAFFDTLYASNRIKLPLEGVTLIGY